MNVFSPLSGNAPPDEQQTEQRNKYNGYHRHGIHLQGICADLDMLIIDRVDAVRPDKQTMGVDAIGCTGHQRDNVLAGENCQFIDLGGEDNEDLLHLVGQNLVQNIDREGIALDDMVKVGEKPCAGQTPVTGNDGVRTCSADRQAAALNVTGSDLQHALACSVVDGQLHADIWYGDIAHDARAGDVENIIVAGDVIKIGERRVKCGKLFVVGVGFFKKPVAFVVVHFCNSLLVACNGSCLMPLIPPIRESRVKHHGDTNKKNQAKNQGSYYITFFLHRCSLWISP